MGTVPWTGSLLSEPVEFLMGLRLLVVERNLVAKLQAQEQKLLVLGHLAA